MDDDRGEDHETLKPPISSILYLTPIASGGGLVFGYYVGFITARFGVLSDIGSILHDTIRTGLVGAIFGAAAGGWTNDFVGRKRSILIADSLIFIGALVLALLLFRGGSGLFSNYFLETFGNMFIGSGVGMASMTSPLYISESSPPKLRNIFVSIDFIFYGLGKFAFSYIYNDPNRTTNYIALAGIAALSQFFLLMPFPESPMWLYKKDREDDAIKALRKMYTCSEVDKEFDAFGLLIRSETSNEDELRYYSSSIFSKLRSAWSSPSLRKQFVVGTALQVVQQLVGINALTYCMPSIHWMSGFGPLDPRDNMLLTMSNLLICFGLLSVFGSFCCTLCLMERFGKKKMLIWSTYCVLAVLLGLSFIFIVSPNTTDVSSQFESTIHIRNNTCSSYLATPDADSWNCLTCLRTSSGCVFSSGTPEDNLGQFSVETSVTSRTCYDPLTLPVTFVFFILVFSCSLEILPWIMNSQMYPTEVRGVYGGTAAVANWTFFLIVIIFYFILTKSQGPLFTFLLISLLSFFVSLFIKSFVPANI
ncbi:hypothetical protein MKW94_014063 [Papaver nudicaule]|uniref:Major facilitator superfamily (MFS) profile domain-containing protein n=1 Tax=Papaver nudicaule TaxID=74823 RepID=A0AA42ATE8_PAPNU|nr:hypothetical protein [Papaver nudicaule]